MTNLKGTIFQNKNNYIIEEVIKNDVILNFYGKQMTIKMQWLHR